MFSLLLIFTCSSLVADVPAPDPVVADRATYETLRGRAGRDARAHVKLALWCEAHGLAAERLKHLALAVLNDPRNVTARGLMGLVAYRGRWESPEKVSERIKADEGLNARRAEYNGRRERLIAHAAPDGKGRSLSRASAAAAHLALGIWCEKNGLDAEAKAHFTSAVVGDPYNDAAWKKLGYIKHDGRWMSREQAAAEQRESEAQKRADRRWEPLLKKWRGWLAVDEKREEARALLADVIDPFATPAIVQVFRDGNEDHERVAVQLLAQIDSAPATRELAALAVLGVTAPVRSAAIEALRGRSARDYAGILVDQIHAPMTYRVEPVRGPGSPGAIYIETPRFTMLRTYDAPPVFQPGANFYGYVGYDSNGMPVITSGKELRRMSSTPGRLSGWAQDLTSIEQRTQGLIATANLKASASFQQLVSDVYNIEQQNAETGAWNERISNALRGATDAPVSLDAGDEDGWHRWWYDRLGYRYDPPPQTAVAITASPQYGAPSIKSCFVAGTPVRTLDGLRPIEDLQVGDQVLSQDTATGGLTFQPILVVHHNPPGKTLRLELDNGESLVPSVYHRFWRAAQGWVIARDLKVGDALRTLEGLARIRSITPGPLDPVYNLDVAESRTFFVGAHGALVHDNTLPPRRTPFDAPEVSAE